MSALDDGAGLDRQQLGLGPPRVDSAGPGGLPEMPNPATGAGGSKHHPSAHNLVAQLDLDFQARSGSENRSPELPLAQPEPAGPVGASRDHGGRHGMFEGIRLGHGSLSTPAVGVAPVDPTPKASSLYEREIGGAQGRAQAAALFPR